MSAVTIDLNVDAGESYGAWTMGDDAALFAEVSSANLACGFHAGDPGTIRRSLARGAGRRRRGRRPPRPAPTCPASAAARMALTPQEVRDDTLYQVGALAAFVRAAGTTLHHVKPHGALNTAVAETSDAHAEAIVEAVAAFDAGDAGRRRRRLAPAPRLRATRASGRRRGLPRPRLRARRLAGAPRHRRARSIHDPDLAAERAVRMALHGTVEAIDGSEIRGRRSARSASTATTPAASRPRGRSARRCVARGRRDRRVLSDGARRPVPAVRDGVRRGGQRARARARGARSRATPAASACARSTPATARSTSSGRTRVLSNDRRDARGSTRRWQRRRSTAARAAPSSRSRCATAAPTPTRSRPQTGLDAAADRRDPRRRRPTASAPAARRASRCSAAPIRACTSRGATTPRFDVPPLSVAIAGAQATIYPPVVLPGGWSADRHRARERLRPAPGRAVPVPARRPGAVPRRGRRAARAADGARAAAGRAAAAGAACRAGRARSTSSSTAAGSTRRTAAWRSRARSTRPSARLANALCGNAPGATLLECTLTGPLLVALRPLVVGAAGGGMSLEVDGEPVGQATTAVAAGPAAAAAPDRPRRARLPRRRRRHRGRAVPRLGQHRPARAASAVRCGRATCSAWPRSDAVAPAARRGSREPRSPVVLRLHRGPQWSARGRGSAGRRRRSRSSPATAWACASKGPRCPAASC